MSQFIITFPIMITAVNRDTPRFEENTNVLASCEGQKEKVIHISVHADSEDDALKKLSRAIESLAMPSQPVSRPVDLMRFT